MITKQEINKVLKNATCIYSKEEVEAALDRMAAEITNKLAAANPVFICVMIGAIIPVALLTMRFNFPFTIDYVHATRYCGSTTGGELTWRMKPSHPIKDRTVVIVDDVLDAGITLKAIIDYCYQEGAKAVHSAVLVNKQCEKAANGLRKADFTGLEAEDLYLFGYGMDYKEYFRNAAGIFSLKTK